MATVENKETVLTPDELTFICKAVLDRSAIVLDESKTYLVQARLLPLFRRHEFAGLGEFIQHLMKRPSTDPLFDEVVDAMTTNETSFFRDIHPFMTLKDTVLPQVIEARQSQRVLNIWCGASSSGQEPFTIAMTLREHFPELASWKLTFWATDVSPSMLKRCNEGVFTQIEVNRGLPAPLMVKYFQKDGAAWILKEEIRNMVDFRQLNLIQSWPLMPKFDIVFMRNVMIYFDADVKRNILEGIRKNTATDGYLFLGTAESMVGVYDGFKHESIGKSMVYRPV